MASESSDPITRAMIETEKEVAGFAWDNEETEALDASGDKSLEDMGDGLEGQHEDDETEGDELAEGEESEDTEGEEVEQQSEVKEPVVEQPVAAKTEVKPEGRVPSGKLREANDRARIAETERDALRADIARREAESAAKLDLVMKEIAAMKTAPREAPRQTEAPKADVIPDIFEDPKGYAEYLQKGFQTEIAKRDKQIADARVETSMAIAHKFHKDTFEKAWEAVNKINVNDPDGRATVQRIYAAPDPGEALVAWHKRNQTLAEVGDDPTAYRERVARETREALLKDPEFRKQLLADMRGEAAHGEDGLPRTTTRLPRSLARAPGSNVGAVRVDPNADDGSPQAIANSAWG